MAKSSPKKGLQPIDLHQRVQTLLVYLKQHGFRVAYELWEAHASTVWVVRPSHQSDHQESLALHEPCQEELYFPWAREIVQLDQKESPQARTI